MYSVRRQLTLVLALGIAVLITGSGFYVANALGAQALEEFDNSLLARARVMQALTEDEGQDIELDFPAKVMPEFERRKRPEYFQFWLDNGHMLYRSPSLERTTVDLPFLGEGGTFQDLLAKGPQIIDMTLPDGRAGRMVQVAYWPTVELDDDEELPVVTMEPPKKRLQPRGVILNMARGRDRLDDLLAGIHWTIFGGGGLAILLSLLLVWRAVAAGFRPIQSIAAQVKGLNSENLDSRVELPRTPEELAPVIDQLNGLLSRLEESFERERRFADNVAHELRTPISELRSLAEVGAKWPDDRESVVQFFDDVRDVAGRMESVIADLLLLARCHAGIEQVQSSPTNLRHVVHSTWSKLEPVATTSGLQFKMELPDDVVVPSDPGKLSIVLANVLGNAVSYAPPNSEIRCVGVRAGERFQLEITNVAEPMSQEDLDNLTEPFWRKDEARSSSDHAGLGLALVSALARLLRLDVRFGQDPEGLFGVRLEGPAAT